MLQFGPRFNTFGTGTRPSIASKDSIEKVTSLGGHAGFLTVVEDITRTTT